MAVPHGIGSVHPLHCPLHCPIDVPPSTRHAASRSNFQRWDSKCCSHAFPARHVHRCVHAPYGAATATGVSVRCASSTPHPSAKTGTAPHAASSETVDEEQQNPSSPITAATAAAQASTAHGLAVQAASAAQEVSADKARSGAQGVAAESMDDVRPKRDAFSKRDTLSPSSVLPHDAADTSQGSASSSRSSSRRIRERLRNDTDTQQPPAHQQPESQQSGHTNESSVGRLADLAEASGSGSMSGYGSSDDHHQDFSDLLTPDEVLIFTLHAQLLSPYESFEWVSASRLGWRLDPSIA